MKNILIVADIYPPEVSSAAHLMKELAEGLKKRGYNVWVATTYPKYYLPKELEDQKFKLFSDEAGIKVIRIKTLPLKKVNFIIRGISQLILPFLFFFKIKKYIREKLDVVIIYSPPLPLALIGGMIKRRYEAKFILNIQDIFPQNAIDLGMLKGWKYKPAIWLFEWIEKKVYKKADGITFHSDGGRKFLIEKKGVPAEKIITLHNWIDIEPFKNLSQDIFFREKFGLNGKFVFVFGGIMGPAQGLEFMVKVAQNVSDLKDLVFLLVGDGTEKQKIEKVINNLNVKNVIIKPFVSKEEYPYLVKDFDVGFVCLSSDNKTSFVPGKILGYMAAAKPIVAFLNKESDGFAVLKEAKCGYAANSDNLEEAERITRKIYAEKNRLKEMGENGFKYALDNLTVEAAVKKLERYF
ncbi:glycosyltransferase family 4 protein [Candidatus Wolfebacteria bacterium]|nr:glycosyltransferase family 4 protein [Candidatus Wolfebacteria bacterium]